ncbi:MAG: PEP-CTERM sorting domain-containing protein, partial [Chthoniobacterales bacterium]
TVVVLTNDKAMPQVTQVQVGMFVLGAQSFSNVRVRLQLWGSFDPAATGTANAFSNPLGGGPSVFTLGPVSSTGNTVFLLTLNLPVAITLPSTMNLGITFNFQSSTDGVTYVDETNLATAMRPVGASGPIPVGQNVTTGGNQYYRNASGRTDFNFNASDARTLGGTQATDGLAFKLTAAVPEPSTWVMMIGGMGMLVVVQRFRRTRKA